MEIALDREKTSINKRVKSKASLLTDRTKQKFSIANILDAKKIIQDSFWNRKNLSEATINKCIV